MKSINSKNRCELVPKWKAIAGILQSTVTQMSLYACAHAYVCVCVTVHVLSK